LAHAFHDRSLRRIHALLDAIARTVSQQQCESQDCQDAHGLISPETRTYQSAPLRPTAKPPGTPRTLSGFSEIGYVELLRSATYTRPNGGVANDRCSLLVYGFSRVVLDCVKRGRGACNQSARSVDIWARRVFGRTLNRAACLPLMRHALLKRGTAGQASRPLEFNRPPSDP
jgi:hypothetical protein